MARDHETHELIGAILTEDVASNLPDGLENISEKFEPILDILGQLDTEYRSDKSVRPGECLHLFLVGVNRSHGGRGVAQQLVTACLDHGKQMGYKSAVTEATNSVSQHVFRKMGFVDRIQRSYRDYRYEGTAPFAKIEGHTGPILMDKEIR